MSNVDISDWDVSKGEIFNSMFRDSTNLTSDFSFWSLDSVEYAEYMFLNCDQITTAPKLPVTTLTNGSCYHGMFNGCISLTKAPELPATKLSNRCYADMFMNCTSLVEAPDLPAMFATRGCYYNMFHNCTSLVKPPKLLAT